ncbi:MFS transporter [Dysgonomonas macrotermitis]|uniref:Maltose/moltooligosaccharide transporter n=1 Tax=Dysgonomonas macrotermitis TaxID=1346286 RepID=A0A1M4WQZ1_9BACT|nr:MFS transporter [Dysgonomonas macrotermitis]SHE83634.1 maltose/moltooligosaccharide transporter [Dysgonomonas macrotermitis]
MAQKPLLSNRQIWDINLGFLGLQICLTLVMANTSRILSSLGANIDQLPLLWLAPPLAGLIIQPIVGYFSDKTWTKWGRRIPYVFIGTILTALMMILMPNSFVLNNVFSVIVSITFILFWTLGALNVTTQPYRSLVADMVNTQQTSKGYSVQTILANIGGIVGSLLPYILTLIGISNQVESSGKIADTVTWSFYIAAGIILVTSLKTCFSVKEYPPHLFESYNNIHAEDKQSTSYSTRKVVKALFQVSIVQLFAWLAFFIIWVYATEGLAESLWNTKDASSRGYNDAANWYGVLSGMYSVVATGFSFFIPQLSHKFGLKNLYASALFIGGLGMISLFYIKDQYLMLLPMIAVGIAWALILTIPFTIIKDIAPAKKMGFYMGILNITIVAPQILGGLTGNFIFRNLAGSSSIFMMVIAGILLFIGAASVFLITDISNKKQ